MKDAKTSAHAIFAGFVLFSLAHGVGYAKSSPLAFTPKKDVAPVSQDDATKMVQPILNLARFTFLAAPGHSGQGAVEASIQIPVGSISDESLQLATDTFDNTDGKALSESWPRYITVPRASLIIGLPHAFDLGVQAGWLPYSKLYTYGAGLQATLIDGPGPSPVVSTRVGVSFMRSAGRAVVSSRTLSFELVAGTRLNRADVYVGFGGTAVDNISRWKFTSETLEYHNAWNDVFLVLGGQSLLLPYLQAGAELQISSVQWAASVKLGLIVF